MCIVNVAALARLFEGCTYCEPAEIRSTHLRRKSCFLQQEWVSDVQIDVGGHSISNEHCSHPCLLWYDIVLIISGDTVI
jgi:hypothetical protein